MELPILNNPPRPGQTADALARFQERHGTAGIVITHDLGVIAEICKKVAVMYAGRIAEIATAEALFSRPAHPYSAGWLAAIPRLDGVPGSALNPIPGTVPLLDQLAVACRYADRCDRSQAQCIQSQPGLKQLASDQLVACHYPLVSSS